MRYCLISRSLKRLWWLFKAHERSLIWNYCILILLIQKHSPVTPSNSIFASKISNKGHPLNKVHTTCMWGTMICFINHVLLILSAYQSCIQSLLVFYSDYVYDSGTILHGWTRFTDSSGYLRLQLGISHCRLSHRLELSTTSYMLSCKIGRASCRERV